MDPKLIISCIEDSNLEAIKKLKLSVEELNLQNLGKLHALAYASCKENPKILEYLVSAGSDINLKTEYGLTPLHFACSWGCLENVRMLLSQNADINAKDKKGKTALKSAQENLYLSKYIDSRRVKTFKDICALLQDNGALI